MTRAMKINFSRFFLLCFFAVTCISVFGASPNTSSENDDASWVVEKVALLLDKIAETSQNLARQFVEHFKDDPHFKLEIKTMFYDRHLRKIFIDFKGSGRFEGELPFQPKKSDYFMTAEGNLAWDFSIEKLGFAERCITFDFHGDLVVSLDKVIYDFTRETAALVGDVICIKGATYLLDFLQRFNSRLVAQAVSKTFTNFSKDALSTSGAEIMQNVAMRKDKTFLAIIREATSDALHSGGIATFLCFSIISASSDGITSCAGSTLGAVVGNILAPGPGALVGAFLGRKISMQIGKTIVYELTVDIPIHIALNKIVKIHKLTASPLKNEFFNDQLEKSGDLILKKIKRETDFGRYETFDKTLDEMGKFRADERIAFLPLCKKLQELLRFKIIEEKDWYSAKKFYQLKQKMESWNFR